jgi:Tol biopolymer transport system component
VCDADGSGLRYLGEFGHHPAWHPTRDAVLWGGGQDDVGPCLFEQPLDGGEPTLFAANTGIHSSVSPDGRYVATDRFDTPEAGTCSLDIIDVATGEGTTLATFPMPAPPYEQSHPHPAWSRDSRRIYFNCAASGIPQLYAVDLP